MENVYNMENDRDTFSDVSESLQEKVRLLTEETHLLRERESKWREEREVLLQRERCWTEKWQERERFWLSAFHIREKQWSDAQFENQRHWCDWKSLYDQKLQDYKTAAQESEVREKILVTMLKEEKRHLIIEFETQSDTVIPQTTVMKGLGEDRIQHSHLELDKHSHGHNSHTLVSFGDFPQELKFLNDPSVNVVEMPPQRLPAVQSEADLKSQTPSTNIKNRKMRKVLPKKQVDGIKEVHEPVKSPAEPQNTISDPNIAKIGHNGDCRPKPAEKASESPKESQWRKEREVLLQRERSWAEQWEERERFWQWTFHVRERQWSEAQSESEKHCDNWKSQYDQLQKDFDDAKQASEAREELLLKLLREDKQHLIIEIENKSEISIPETKSLTTQALGEDNIEQTQDSEQFWRQAFHVREQQWLDTQRENGKRWKVWKTQYDQLQKDFDNATQESEAREKLFLKLLREDQKHLIIEIENKSEILIPETKTTQALGEDNIKQTEDREQFWRQAFHAREQQWLDTQRENEKHWEVWKSQYDQLQKDCKNAAQESEVREELLLKMLREDKQHLIIEIEKKSDISIPETNITSVKPPAELQKAPCKDTVTEDKGVLNMEDLTTQTSPEMSAAMTTVQDSKEASEKAESSLEPKEISTEVEVAKTEAPLNDMVESSKEPVMNLMQLKEKTETELYDQKDSTNPNPAEDEDIGKLSEPIEVRVVLQETKDTSNRIYETYQPEETMNLQSSDANDFNYARKKKETCDRLLDFSELYGEKSTEAEADEPQSTQKDYVPLHTEHIGDKGTPAEAPLDHVAQQSQPQETFVSYLKDKNTGLLSCSTKTQRKKNKKVQKKQRDAEAVDVALTRFGHELPRGPRSRVLGDANDNIPTEETVTKQAQNTKSERGRKGQADYELDVDLEDSYFTDYEASGRMRRRNKDDGCRGKMPLW